LRIPGHVAADETRVYRVSVSVEGVTDMLVSIELSIPTPSGLSVPADAVVDSGLAQRVYVKHGAGNFESRQVETGERFGDRVQIVRGWQRASR
jgi:multidrug efflux pump subunit AcrA (membrane-fusion protein)